MVREQLDALGELAQIDRKFRTLDGELTDIQGQLEALRTDVGRIRDLLDREKAQLADAERLRIQTVDEGKDLEERITRSTGRGNVARNTREKEASSKEVEVLRREKDERIAKGQELEKTIVQVRESIVRHDGEFLQLQEALAQEERDAAERTKGIDASRADIDEQRKGLLSKVRPDLLRKYEGIRSRKGTAVADVWDGVCRSCNVSLPPQMFAKLVNYTDVFQCPSCQRLLILRQTSTQ